MSTAKRKGIEFSLNQIGNAFFAIDDLIGETTTPDKALLNFENTYIRLKGSTIFNDYDLSKKDPNNLITSDFNTFDILETADLAIQGGSLIVKDEITNFSNFSTWNPLRYSPPSPEGWLIYDYNAWSNYIPRYNSSGNANTNYIIYDIYGEPNSGASRTSFDYPVRFTGFGDTYERVPLVEYGSWVSISNLGGTTVDEINIVIPKKYFGGSYNIDPFSNTPNDFLVMSHQNLKSSDLTDPITFAGFMGTKGVSDKLEVLPFRISECDDNGELNSINVDFYRFDINFPIGYTWSESEYRHLLFYWGSFDNYVTESKLAYSRTENTIDSHYGDYLNASYYIFPKKNFFNKNLKNTFIYDKTGVNDSNIYLYSNNKSNHIFKESFYNTVKYPFRYILDENIENSSIGKTNSIIGYRTVSSKQYIPFVIACKNDGLSYDNPVNDLEIFYGFPISSEAIPNNWTDLGLYPSIPENYIPIAKLIAKNSEINFNTPYFTNNTSYFSNDLSIIHIEMVPKNVLQKAIGDANISLFFGSIFKQLKDKIRTKEYISFLNFAAQNILTKFSRYNLNKIINKSQFASLSSLEFKALHALIKLPYDELLQNANNAEPKAIQFNLNSSNLISKFALIPPSINFGGFASTSLFFDTKKLVKDTDFEIYLEKNINEIDDRLDNNRGSEKDYSFKIKFSNTKNEFTIKNIFVNASKFYLTDLEYANRENKKLNLDGYFKPSTLNSIEDFSINSYAAVVPDLKFEDYRTIINKFNSPVNSTRITEQEFESALKVENSNINKDSIIVRKIGFGLTDAFYVVDESKPSDLYNGIDDLGITTTEYSQNKNPKWINNTNSQNDLNNTSIISNAIHVKDLRLDGFLISKSGFGISDNSINELENRDNQRVAISSEINQLIFHGFQNINKNKIALKIENDKKQQIKSFKIKLKKTSDIFNNNSEIKAYLYSDKNGLPNEILATGSSIFLKNISEKLEDYYFELEYTLFENKNYWVVLFTNQLPPIYDPFNYGLVNINGTEVTGAFNFKTNKTADLSKYLRGAEIGFGSTSGLGISSWYQISSIGSSNNLTISSVGQTANNQLYSVRYSFDLSIKESSAIGATKNIAYFESSIGWTSFEGTAFIEFYKPEVDIYASLNRDFTNSNIMLPPPNKYREIGTNKVDGFWSFNCKPFFNDQKLYLYPRSLKLQKFEVIGSGTSNSNLISVDSYNYNNRILSGLALSDMNYYAAGTSITNVIYDSSNDKYFLYLSSNLLSSFDDSVVGIGTNYNLYLKRANDINIILKYKKFSGTAITNITLPKSPTWITYWQNSNRTSYKNLVKTNTADNITATYNLNIENYDLSNYIVGYSVGDFNIKSGIGTSFDFRFYSSGGLKVFLNDSSTPVIDRWTQSNSMIGSTFSTSLSSTVKFEVHFNNSKIASGAGQTLIGQWKISGTSEWNSIDDSFYLDSDLAPILIDSDDIQKIEYMYCDNNNSIFNSPNLNSPINDRLIIRSK